MFKNLHPRKTKNLIGHEEQIKTFVNIFKTNKLHHAWLLEGAAGVGKATFAYCLSRAILSKNIVNKNEPSLLNDHEQSARSNRFISSIN